VRAIIFCLRSSVVGAHATPQRSKEPQCLAIPESDDRYNMDSLIGEASKRSP
jgi:hypothetical protein